ncbi:MAG: hypothetical protein M3Q29_06510 [Chloroflexota bacterium]|nr:hypothetical protein [Chloroflexota bacterium]
MLSLHADDRHSLREFAKEVRRFRKTPTPALRRSLQRQLKSIAAAYDQRELPPRAVHLIARLIARSGARGGSW